MAHLDPGGGADNRVELIKHQRLYGLKGMVKEPIGAIEPLLSCTVMVTFVLGLALRTQMIMVPRDQERVSDVLRDPLQELCLHHVGLLIRDNDSSEVRSNGCEDCAEGSRVDRFEQVSKPRKRCTHAFFGPGFSWWRAELSCCLKQLEPPSALVVACHGVRTSLGRLCVLCQALVEG